MDGSLQHNLSQDNKRKPNVGKFLAGNACILIATIFWGVNVSVTKALIPEWMTSEGVSAVRLIGGCVLFWIASSFVHCDKINRQDWKKLILGGFVGLFGFIYLFVMSLKYANPIDVSIIMTLPPLFVILMGVFSFIGALQNLNISELWCRLSVQPLSYLPQVVEARVKII